MSSKRKGSKFERQVAKDIAEFLDVSDKEIYRSQPRAPFDQMHGDIFIPEHLKERFPFCIECKHTNDWSLEGFLANTNHKYLDWGEQVLDNVQEDDIPAIFFKKDRSPIFVFLPSTDEDVLDYVSGSLVLPFMGVIVTKEGFFNLAKFAKDINQRICIFGKNKTAYQDIITIKEYVKETKKEKS